MCVHTTLQTSFLNQILEVKNEFEEDQPIFKKRKTITVWTWNKNQPGGCSFNLTETLLS